ncbi:hypothetical protein BJ508DRAFT_327055 [Ascobolus immersus RN42]|uniref:Uncharacterized protein n=1 Tax=Ascobolus immersus RN42 TaxID=1160509 RepID=A0A3N4I9B4_ASCIM|nr:hypothetical protein BJ508DRAFT_327055 [Ascobolus immersus RN42]
MTKPPVRLPYDIVLLVLKALDSFDDLYSLIRASPDYYLTYHAKQEQILKNIADKVLPECYMGVLDVQRPPRYSCQPTESFGSLGGPTQARSWIEYQTQWSAQNSFTETQDQTFYTLRTRRDLSPVPGTFRNAELNCLMQFEDKVGDMIDQYKQNYAEYDMDGLLEIQCRQMHVNNLHLSMLMESVWQDEWDGGPYRFSAEEDKRLKKGIYQMYALTNHIHSFGDVHSGLLAAQKAQNEEDLLAAQLAQTAGLPVVNNEAVSIPIPQPHDFYLDASFLYTLSFREHIHLISVLHHFRAIYAPHFLLPDWLDSDPHGGLLSLHLVERFDFTQTDIYDTESGFYLNKTNNNRQARSRKVVKGLLTFADSYGLYDVFQNQITRMERQLKPYVTKSGYNDQHFFVIDVYQNTPVHKKILILRPKHTPHITRPSFMRAIGFGSHGDNSSQYLPKLKERLLSEDEHDPNSHFASSMPTVELVNEGAFDEEEEEEDDEYDEEYDGLDEEMEGYLTVTN